MAKWRTGLYDSDVECSDARHSLSGIEDPSYLLLTYSRVSPEFPEGARAPLFDALVELCKTAWLQSQIVFRPYRYGLVASVEFTILR